MENKKKADKPYSEDLKEYLQKIVEKQIPIKNREFQVKVENFRKYWGINKRGFRDNKAIQKWINNPINKQHRVKRKIQIPEEEIVYKSGRKVFSLTRVITSAKGFEMSKNVLNSLSRAYNIALKRFVFENGIDETLTDTLQYFILRNNLKNAPFPKGMVELSEIVSRRIGGEVINRQVCLKFSPNTRKEDVNAIFTSNILPLQKSIPGYLEHKSRNRKSK